jgi:hypothetical protein
MDRWMDGKIRDGLRNNKATSPSSRIESSGHFPRLGCIHGGEGPSTYIAVWCQVGRPFELQKEGRVHSSW